jgi:hypothetical protein
MIVALPMLACNGPGRPARPAPGGYFAGREQLLARHLLEQLQAHRRA